jgi:hypothetical protein
MLRRIALAALAAAALAWPAAGQEKAAKEGPKKLSGSQTSSITATVEAIDTAHRELTLKGPGGKVVVLQVPEAVKRFNEIKVGDQVVIRVTEALALAVVKP